MLQETGGSEQEDRGKGQGVTPPRSGEQKVARCENIGIGKGVNNCALETRNEIFAHLPARPSLDALYPDVSRLATLFHAALRPMTEQQAD